MMPTIALVVLRQYQWQTGEVSGFNMTVTPVDWKLSCNAYIGIPYIIPVFAECVIDSA